MRQLTEDETKTMLSKLASYCGRSINNLIVGTDGNEWVFRLHGNRVYYMRKSLANLSTAIPRANLLTIGTCIGKFTKGGAFRIHITGECPRWLSRRFAYLGGNAKANKSPCTAALDVIAPHARHKVWVKNNGVFPYLYGGNLIVAHIGRWNEDCPEHSGVVVFDMNDTPLVRCKQEQQMCYR